MSPPSCLPEKPNSQCLISLLQRSWPPHVSCVTIPLVEPGSYENLAAGESRKSIFYFPVFTVWEGF